MPATIEGMREPASVASALLPDAGAAARRRPARAHHAALAVRQPDLGPRRAPARSSAMRSASRPTCRRPSAATATTAWPSCIAAGWSGALIPRWTARRGACIARAVYLEPGIAVNDELLDGLAGALRDLARFLGATSIAVDRSEPADLAPALAERLS